jgi:tartrate dehydrogenase/decarboxylase/D-malate dehydrogenase
MFEPIHGSAPDIFGKGIANPIAMIWSGAMMLEFLGEVEAAELIVTAILHAAERGKVHTPDLGGRMRTHEVADAILESLGANEH